VKETARCVCYISVAELNERSSHVLPFMLLAPNHLAVNLLRLPNTRRLRRFLPNDLPDRF
jgi:hypothetical protein